MKEQHIELALTAVGVTLTAALVLKSFWPQPAQPSTFQLEGPSPVRPSPVRPAGPIGNQTYSEKVATSPSIFGGLQGEEASLGYPNTLSPLATAPRLFGGTTGYGTGASSGKQSLPSRWAFNVALF